jgi:chorismate dehydratase
LDKIKVGIVNYLNTRPLIYGLQRPPISEKIELIGDYPSRLVPMLKSGEIDVGLIPVAAIKQLPEYHIIGNHCIGAEGEIASVALFSEVPMEKIETVLLDYQSMSSVALLKWLMKDFWGIHPNIVSAKDEHYRDEIRGTTAGLVIGDRALEQRRISSYIYDLGSEWKAITGLPFVFAAWVSIRPLPQDFIKEFDEANELGMQYIDEIVTANAFPLYDLAKYYKLHLSYELDDRKRKAMEKFLELISDTE